MSAPAAGLRFQVYFSSPAATPFDEKEFAEFERVVTHYGSPRCIELAGPGNFIWALQKAAQFQAHLKYFESERPKAMEEARKAYAALEKRITAPKTPEESLSRLTLQDAVDLRDADRAAKAKVTWISCAIARIKTALDSFQAVCQRLGVEGCNIRATERQSEDAKMS